MTRPQDRSPDDRDLLVVATVPSVEAARLLAADLEEHGIPAEAINLHGVEPDPEPPDPRKATPEAPIFADVAKSVILGGVAGAVAGALLGLLASLVFADVSWLVAALLGALFGSGVGGAAGGVSVVKYSSSAWRESFETEAAGGTAAVSVRHADLQVVEDAEQVMGRHESVERLRRLDDGPAVR